MPVSILAGRASGGNSNKEADVLWTLVVILLLLWLFGYLITPFGGNLIHLLLVIVLILVIVQLVTGRRV
jgi:hypothetical protein